MSNPFFKVVIPARYGSTRLPGKPMREIAGKPMIQHVCERAQEANAEQIVVATDDKRIFDFVLSLGIDVVMTSEQHQSGTERINEVAEILNWSEDNIIVNLQGDEPLVPPTLIQSVAHELGNQQQSGMATLASRISEVEEIFDPNAVKVVLDKDRYALYFSRAPIPWDRKSFSTIEKNMSADFPYFRHIGMYAYTVNFLKRYCRWEPSKFEEIESLEQLRVLWHGESILVKVVDQAPEAGVDTESDLLRIESAMLRK